MAGDGEGRSLLRWGCLGCAGCLGLILLLVLVLAGIAWLGASSQTFEDVVRTREVPVPTAPAAPEAAPPSAAAASGRVVLDLAQAGFFIRAGEPGAPARVEARYPKETYVLEESLEQPQDGPWTFRVGFHASGPTWATMLRSLFSQDEPELTVYLPPDVPLELDIEVRQGGAEIDLGGLWLTTAEIDVQQGGAKLTVAEPLRAPMTRLTLRGSMGGVVASRLANASPAELSVETRMGGLELDLGGQWKQDARISLRSSMGGAKVRLPRDVRLVGVPGRGLGLESAPPEVALPTLTFEVEAGEGEIQFVD